MPNYGNILARDKKKIDITDYLKDILTDGETAFLTLVRIPEKIKSKIKIYALSGIQGKLAEKMFDLQREKGGDEITEADMAGVMSCLTEEERERMQEITYQVELEKLKNGIDKKDHNFFDDNGLIELTDDFFDVFIMPREGLKKFLLDEVDRFNDSALMGEKKPSS
jgi:hypothetical protein